MTRIVSCILIVSLGAALAADGPESANVRGDSTTTRKRLAETEQKVLSGQSSDALDELQRILDEAGDDLVTADGKLYISARHYVHRFLAKLPQSALNRYRDRVQEPAARMLEHARKTREPGDLIAILDRYAVSRPAEDAILLLAEIAFERGEFGKAERYWRSLLPEADPAYPQPRTPAVQIEARVILSTIRRGDRTVAARMLEEFAKKYPKESGRLAGRTGTYLQTLLELINEPKAPTLTSTISQWTTLGGSAARDGLVDGSLPRHLPTRPTWKTPIPAVIEGWKGKTGRPPAVGAVKSLAFHPVILDQHAYIADAGRVIAFDLRSGASRLVFDSTQLGNPRVSVLKTGVPSAVDADYALMAAEGMLVLRIGEADHFPSSEDGGPIVEQPSVIVGLSPNASNAPDAKATVLWKRFPPVPKGIPATWEGAPLLVDGNLYAVFIRSEAGRNVHAIACYRDASDRPSWVVDLCEANVSASKTRHELLTLAGRNLVFCSHSGVIAAVNAKTGRSAWAYRYPRIRKFAADGRHRDIAPPVYSDGRVFVAPNDTDQLLAFDADSGQLLWSEGPILIDHLIGAANGRVVATIAGPQRGLRAFDAATGSTDFPHGWRNHDDPFLATYGRGLISEELIAWPTASALYMIRLMDGTVAAQPIRFPHGNLAFANGVLLVATPSEVWGYVVDHSTLPPPAPPPIVIGQLQALPQPLAERKPEFQPLPAIADAKELVQVSAPVESLAVPLGEPDLRDDHVRLIRRHGTQTEIIDSNGQSKNFPEIDASRSFWNAERVVVANDRRLSMIDSTSGTAIWSREFAEIRAIVVRSNGIVLQAGAHTLVALHPETGATSWLVNTKNEPREMAYAIESMPRFLNLSSTGSHAIVQTSNGQRWLLDATTGRRIHVDPTTERTWWEPPLILSDRSLVFADGANRITKTTEQGRVLWSVRLGYDASLTGEPVSLRRLDNDTIFALVRRNHGLEIERLRPTDGQRLWFTPALLNLAGVESCALVMDRRNLYVATMNRLIALRIDTGHEAWSCELSPPGRWRIEAARDRLLAYPAESIAPDSFDAVYSFAKFPHTRRFIGILGTAWDQVWDQVVPLRIIDPETGELRKSFEIRASGPVAVRMTAGTTYLTAGGAIFQLR